MKHPKLRSLLCLLLAALLMLSSLPALADGIGTEVLTRLSTEDKSGDHFTIYAEYTETDNPSQLKAHIIVQYNRGTAVKTAQNAKNVVVSLETEEGLQILEGNDYYLPEYDMVYGDMFSMDILLGYEEPEQTSAAAGTPQPIPEPKLIVMAQSSHTKSTVYICRFDATARARAMVAGWDMNNGTAVVVQDSVDKMTDLFSSSYYNGRPVEVADEPYFDHPEFWDIVSDMAVWEPDDNDITYLYISTHGAGQYTTETEGSWFSKSVRTVWNVIYPNFVAYTTIPPDDIDTNPNQSGPWKQAIKYTELFANLKLLQGKVVVIFEICFSGQAVDFAADAGLDPDRFTIIASTDEKSELNVASEYSPFTRAIYNHATTNSGAVTAKDIIDDIFVDIYMDVLDEKYNITPYSYGNTSTVLFCSDPKEWIEDPQLIIMEETIEVTDDWVKIYYNYLREEVVPKIGLAGLGQIVHPLGEDCSFWTEKNPDFSGLLSAAVCDFDQDGKQDLLTVTVRSIDDADRLADTYYAIDLALYQIENGRVVQSDEFKNAVKLLEDYLTSYMVGVTITLSEYDGSVELYIGSGFTLVHPSHYDYSKGTSHYLDIKEGKFIEGKRRSVDWDLNYYTADGDIFYGHDYRTAPDKIEYLATVRFERKNGLDNRSVDYRHPSDPCCYEAVDFTHLADYINESQTPEYYDMVRLTAQPAQKSEYELLCEANEQAIIDAMGENADSYNLHVYTAESGDIERVYFIASADFLKNDAEKQQVWQDYLAVLNADVLGFTEDEISQLSELKLKTYSHVEVNDSLYAECQQIDDTRVVIDISLQ